MPRVIDEGAKPIMLRKLLTTFKIGRGAFINELKKATGIDISAGSLRYVLDSGYRMARIPDFESILADFVAARYPAELKAMNLMPADIWKPLEKDVQAYAYEDEEFLRKLRIITEVEMLTEKTMKHFKLKENPFQIEKLLPAKQMFMGANHTFALEVMRSVALTGGFAVVTGQVGSGKSTVRTRFFAEAKAESYRIVFVKSLNKKKLNSKTLLNAIIYDLSEQDPKGNDESLIRQAEKLLLASYQNNEKVVVVIEEAQDLTVEMLKTLKRLYELDDGEYNRLVAIILIAQPELETRLYKQNNPELREVSARTTHARLDPLEDDVKGYVERRLKNIGSDMANVITPQAMDELIARMRLADRGGKTQAMTYPLYINTIMMRLMNQVARSGEDLITPETITMVGI